MVAADDRTGALETAGALARALGMTVTVGTRLPPSDAGDPVVVVDLGTRHLAAAEAAERAAGMGSGTRRRAAHKIDSTLRGNWATELTARGIAGGAPILVVPALPALGRVCVEGHVVEGGRPVHEGPAQLDRTRRLTSSRPAALLAAAGATSVVEVAPGDRLEQWLDHPIGIAVCDAASDDDLRRIGEAWSAVPEVLLAGTSAVIAAGAVAAMRTELPSVGVPRRAPSLRAPVVVVCGSLHPAARRQLEQLRARRASPDIAVVTTDPPGDRPADAVEVLTRLASVARRVIDERAPRTLVLIGGDTAAAVLGDQVVVVGGEIVPGTPWGHVASGELVITRAGGFGGPEALVDLLSDTLWP